MDSSNFEDFSDGDWDNSPSLSWNERDWHEFLLKKDEEVAKFRALYRDRIGKSARLDEIASLMSWDMEDWNSIDEGENFLIFPDISNHGSDFEMINQKDVDPDSLESISQNPYTIHCHPVYIVCSGLFSDLRDSFIEILKEGSFPHSSLDLWDFGITLTRTEKEFFMAIHALDLADFLLSICHMKRVLANLNSLLDWQDRFRKKPFSGIENWDKNTMVRLFDLREVCLRLIKECRKEAQSFREEE